MKRLRPAFLPCLLASCLWAARAEATDFIQLETCPAPTVGMYCYWAQPVLGPAAQWVAWTDASTYAPHYEYWPTVVVMARDGSHRIGITVDGQGRHHSPAWSHDGRWLALFVDSVGPAASALWVVDFVNLVATGSTDNAEKLVESPKILQASWSLDDQQLAFEQEGQGIWVVPRAGGTATQVVADGRTPSWGPDGSLVFERQGDLWLRLPTGEVQRRTHTVFTELSPAWSPSGEWIAYTSDEAGTWDIWVIGASGGSRVRVTEDKPFAVAPAWSADGTALVFVTLEGADTIWLATHLPDWTTRLEQRGWGQVKQLYR